MKRAGGRLCCVVSVLLGLTVPILARGDDTEQPVAANGQCSVPGDPQWTPQENFVWQHVCVGEQADFNQGSNYGGYLDPNGPKELPQSRVLRPAFLETILLKDKYLKVLTRHEVRIVGARLTDILDLQNVQLGGMFALERSLLEKGANFSGLKSAYTVSLRGSTITGGLLMTEGQVGGRLSLRGAKITGPLVLEELQIGESLNMDGAQFDNIALIDVHVGGQFNLIGSEVNGQVLVQGVQIYSTAHLSRGAKFAGPVAFIFSKVGQNVELAGGFFQRGVDFTGTQIEGELRLGRSDFGGPALWSPNSMLILRNTSVRTIQDLPNSWPGKLDLNGFTYRNLGGISGAGDKIQRPDKWFIGWLGSQASYAPAPYQQLASVLREQGRPDTADGVLYAGKQRERAQSSSLSWVGLTLSWLFIGYGYHLFWSVYWAFGFLVAGSLLLWLSGEGWRISRHYKGPWWGPPPHGLLGLIYGLFYSFDLLLPIIRLRDRHYQIDLKHWVRYYFYFHKIMGYVLAAFLIAGIGGLTKLG